MRWWLPISILCLIDNIDNANILAVFPLAGRSHYVMFESILKGLAAKGHQLDVVSHFPQKKPIQGYNDLSILGTQHMFVNNVTVDNVVGLSRRELFEFMMGVAGVQTCQATFNAGIVQNLRNSTKKYDLVIVEFFTTDCMLGWGYHFKAPVVAMTSSVALPWSAKRFGNPDNPSYIPTYEVDFVAKMTLWERMVNTYRLVTSKLYYYYISEIPSNKLAKEFFGPDLPNLSDLADNASLLLLNSHFSMNQARPLVPNIIEVGGVHISEPKPLDKHFQSVVQTNTKGIIFLTMGSMVLTESFPVNIIQGMFDAFAELPYKVIWKANREKFPKEVKFPSNIHFENWMPQMDILCHPNVKLFVSHGGLMGSQEAIYCGVPRLGIPIFGDQELNIRQSQNMGLAIKVSYDNITKESILGAAQELLNNPKYKKKADQAAKLFKDRPASALDTAIFWIEYVIRYKGAPHLRSEGSRLAWYQYYLLDVGLIFVSGIVGGIVGFAYVVLCIVKLANGSKTDKRKRD